jgi:hypothetical protein
MTTTYYIPVYDASPDGHPNPPPQQIAEAFESLGLGKVSHVDIVPRGDPTPSLEWAVTPVPGTKYMAFVHMAGDVPSDSSDIEAIADPDVEYHLEWDEGTPADAQSTHFKCDEGALVDAQPYWIVCPSQSSGSVTEAAATYHKDVATQHPIVTLRSVVAHTQQISCVRAAIHGHGASAGKGPVPPGLDTSLRLDLSGNSMSPDFANPRASVTGDFGYTMTEFTAYYGLREGHRRFTDAPIAPTTAPITQAGVRMQCTIGEMRQSDAVFVVDSSAFATDTLSRYGVASVTVSPDDPTVLEIDINVMSAADLHMTNTNAILARSCEVRRSIWHICTLIEAVSYVGFVKPQWSPEPLQSAAHAEP